MTVNQKREVIKGAYKNSKSWHATVDKMSDEQVVAIYIRVMNRIGSKK